MRRLILFLSLSLVAGLLPAQSQSQTVLDGVLAWSVGTPAAGHAGHGVPGLAINATDARLWLYTPDLQRRALAQQGGAVALARTGMDNYHLYLAERQEGRVHEWALYYRHQSGRPVGNSPFELINLAKAGLDIRPDPLPREHRDYWGGTPVQARILFRGQPLVGVAVQLQTTNGSRQEALSDERGRVSFTLPDDFPVTTDRDSPDAYLQLAVAHAAAGEQYHTTLTLPYAANPTRRWQDPVLAWWVLGSGFAFGLGLVHFKNKERKP